MSRFKGPRQFVKASVGATPSKPDQLSMALGFSDDDDDDLSVSDSGSEQEQESEEEGGISFLEYLALQKSLRAVSEQKRELLEQVKRLKEELRKSERASTRAIQNSKTQVAILTAAQKTQLSEKDNLLDALRLSLDEIEEGTDGGQAAGIKQMVETITKLSAEKRTLFERAELAEAQVSQLKEDSEVLVSDHDEKIAELKAELAELQGKIDPAKAAVAASQPTAALDNQEIQTLREENSELRSKLREAEFSNTKPVAEATSGVSSAEVGRLEGDIKERDRKLRQLSDDLRDAKASLAKMQALSDSGSEKDKQQHQMMEQLTKEANAARTQVREIQDQMEEISGQLSHEKSAHARVKAELDELKAGIESELQAAKGQAEAGQDAMKSLQAQLAQSKASLNAEKSEHEETKKDLSTTKSSLTQLKQSLGKMESDSQSALAAERERAATALQTAKADAAAEVAELKQRAIDDRKDLEERLSGFANKFKPMVEAIKFVSKQYRQLQRETRDLQGEIAPAVKQAKRDLLRTLADVDKNYKEMLRKYRKEMSLRKKLHNELVDLKGNIRVFARVRPTINEDGKGSDSKVVVSFDGDDDQLLKVQNKGKEVVYEMDNVFNMKSQQEDVFNACHDIIVSVVDGFNVCIFAYGQTGSGKTFTMDGSDDHPGLNRRALGALFDLCKERSADWSYEIEVSVLEIYNEQLRDLLSEKPKAKLEIKHGKSGPHVPGLTKQPVQSPNEVREWFQTAQKVRATSSTDMNEHSSRSHALLVVYVVGTNLSTGVQTKGKLNLIDLAGSERVSKSGAIHDDERFKEATSINKSLSSLGDVIHALGAKQKHIPYRNSKLTHLLQDSLGGHAKTLMVVQISPVLKNVQESVCSLNFAQRVRAVELGGAKKTTESAEVAALKRKIREMEK
eukprot:m.479338 g.479338  ORF g.479338 m.479338 type:complete len:909 (+) comp21408_c0_seq1:82-2808(+)